MDMRGELAPVARSRLGRPGLSLATMLLLAVFIGQGLTFALTNSQTFDEASYLAAGYSYLDGRGFRLMPEHPPLAKELAALPVYVFYRLTFSPDAAAWNRADQWVIGRDFLYRSAVSPERILLLSRLPNLLLGTLLVGLVGWWAYRLWGPGAGVLGMALAALEPNLVAHSALVTTDIGSSFFMTLTLYFLWEYSRSACVWLLLGVGLSAGLGLATKYSTLLVLGFIPLALAVPLLPDWLLPPSEGHRGAKDGMGQRFVGLTLGAVLICGAAALILSLAYAGEGFSSWWHGLQLQVAHQRRGHRAFFLGQYSWQGWRAYFPVAFLIKTPLGSLLLICVSLLGWRLGKPFSRREVAFVLLPAFLCFAAMTRLRVNIGVRYVLPVYPLLFIAASRLATVRLSRRWLGPWLLAISVALVAGSALRLAPHQLAYFNELVGGPAGGYRYLSDSNIDWGQDLRGLKAYMDREAVPMIYLSYFGTAPPACYGIRYQYAPTLDLLDLQTSPRNARLPETGRQLLAISVVNLQGVLLEDNDLYHWLYARTPVAKIGYSIYIYDLTGDADAHVQLADVYRKTGLADLAALELRKACPNERASGGRYSHPHVHVDLPRKDSAPWHRSGDGA